MNKIIIFLSDIFHKIIAFIKQISIVFFYFIVVVSLQLTFKRDVMSSNTWIANISSIFIELIVLTIFIFIFRKTIIPDYYEFKKNGKNYIKKSAIFWILGLIIMIISNLILSNFIGTSVNEELNQNLLERMPIYSSITMIIVAPIVEELITRVILKDTFKRPTFYVLTSGLIFGALHLFNITSLEEIFYIIPYGALGCSFSFIYYKTKNIWTSISFHSIHNAIALLLFFIGG
ncbi:MAG: CPBP family intramembrane metalloprotease [Firmicutes bacterium]|nr:CPBP family intramembrane metalloprotease [Bacillota bacterium]